LAERLKASVLKTEGAQVPGGSNPSPSDWQRILLALGMARGLLSKLPGKHFVENDPDWETLQRIDKIISEVCYKKKPKKTKGGAA
jgi:hypothetical protein